MPARAQCGDRIDAGMMPEMLILVQECGGDEFRRNGGKRRAEAILVVARQPDAQEPPVTIVNALRKPDAVQWRRRFWQAEPERPECNQQEGGGEREEAKDGAEAAHGIGFAEEYGMPMTNLSTKCVGPERVGRFAETPKKTRTLLKRS